ncbi:MAG: carbon monoxide dehydrogenase subunit G [Anaerolineae bacterium]|nr:carbon monoxide dehydrogenase subunit G [Anaerolineae bacterium]
MKLEGEYIFDGTREEVWQIVRDPEVLVTALPGTQSLEQVGENEWAGEMFIRIGPVSGVFSGKLVVSDEVPPEGYTLSVEGRGAPGFGSGTGHVQLLDHGDGQTLMKYEGEMQVGGRLAAVGQRLIDTASRSMIAQGLESLNRALQARHEAVVTGVEVEYTPPSESQFAAAVARDMARDMTSEFLSSPQALWALVAVVAAVGMLIGFLLGRGSRDKA